MTLLTLIWTTVYLWTTVSSQTPPPVSNQTVTLLVRYPKILDTETLTCECLDRCQAVYWFRSQHNDTGATSFQYLLHHNQADRCLYGSIEVKDQTRFKTSRRDVGGDKVAFSLRIINVTEQDAGLYSCVFQNKKQNELWRPGVLLRPGVTPPTLPPVTKPPIRKDRNFPNCRCTKGSNKKLNGCGTMVLWPLVGILLGLAVVLIFTLYYFSRLPRKCKHRFAKKRYLN